MEEIKMGNQQRQQRELQLDEQRRRPIRPPQVEKEPSIEGTYRIRERIRPDGSIQRPPDILGIHTFTKDLRNFNVRWIEETDIGPKYFQVAVTGTYTLTREAYTELGLYYMNNNIKQEGPDYQSPGMPGRSPVNINADGSIEIQFPFEQPLYIFGADGYRVESLLGNFFWNKVSVLFSVQRKFAQGLNRRRIPPELRREFEAHRLRLSDHSEVEVKIPNHSWLIHDEPRKADERIVYRIQRAQFQLDVYKVFPE
jgi:hypothetical protein